MNINIVTLIAVVTAVSSAQDGVVPVEEEPHHKTVLKNDYVLCLFSGVLAGERRGEKPKSRSRTPL